MKNKILLPVLLLILSCTYIPGYAQYENVWVFGYNNGVDFNYDPPVAFKSALSQHEGCASICDAKGQLLFYTDGTNIYDRSHNIMPNGNLLRGRSTWTITQPAVITELPGAPGKYFVFSNCYEYFGIFIRNEYIYYHTVDMQNNNGLGDVVRKDSLFLPGITEKMTVVKGDSCNLWLVFYNKGRDRLPVRAFYAYRIDRAGVHKEPVISSFPELPAADGELGTLKFSTNGLKLALVGYGLGIRLGDFDPSSGVVSNIANIDSNLDISPYGACFSPDDTKLYVSGSVYGGKMYQYDLTQSNIAASKIDINPAKDNDSFFVTPGQIKLGPDKKRIYRIASYVPKNDFSKFRKVLDAIDYPNLAGLACGYRYSAVFLTGIPDTAVGLGLPNDVGILPRPDTATSFTEIPVCFKDSITITAPDTLSASYSWSTGAGGAAIAVSETGNYVVIYNDGCKIHIDTFYVLFKTKYLPGLTTFSKSCHQDDNLDFAVITPVAGDTNRYNYSWYNTENVLLKSTGNSKDSDTLFNLAAGSYTLKVTTASGCDTTLFFTIKTPEPYSAHFLIDSFLCETQPHTFHNTSSGNVNIWYWDFGDGNFSTLRQPQHSYTKPGAYRVALIAFNDMPCYDTFYRYIVVDTLGYVHLTVDKKQLCAGDAISVYPVFTTGLISLAWDWGNGSYSYNSGSVLKHAYDQVGVYPLTVTGQFRACPDISFTDSIIVYPLPVVHIGYDSVLCLNGTSVILKSNGPHIDGHQYKWSTGDTTQALKVLHHGDYSLTVTSAYGCAATERVRIDKDCYLDIPNAFTPNGDGVNDYFFPRKLLSRGIQTLRMQVLNRWGQLLFETRNIDGRGWDGRFNGKEQPAGVYIYIIEIMMNNGEMEKYEGNITVLR